MSEPLIREDAASAEVASEAAVLPTRPVWSSWQGAVGHEYGLEVDAFLVGGPSHFFFLLAAASFWLSWTR